MAIKRKRRASPSAKGLAAGEQFKRNKLACNDYSAWGWVGTEVTNTSSITREHLLATCGFSRRNALLSCPNLYVSSSKQKEESHDAAPLSDIVIISDDESPQCNKKLCKTNPNCLNYLGQEEWEDEDGARELFLNASDLGQNPIFDTRDPNLPVGLKNLGATCYANAFLQVWFRDLAFRTGVYRCQPSQDMTHQFEKSPIFQLQVTFAALQESTQSVFNPTNFVESLQLRTTEQQDAQEFSKLFISHLDAEFQKQSDPSLQSLITGQFQGKQVYGTICGNNTCHYRSERVTDFLEIEINFENSSNLEGRIAALLQPEKLSGDNKYLCPQCDSLQDATRYTELRELPPILHFSLLRFVYDFASMERKKSKHSISFPTSLDMGRFLGTASRSSTSANHTQRENEIYELRGVLLHKGSSAYHGHYEAQVFDTTNQTWFQFNDETVTKIKPFSGKRTTKRPVTNPDDDNDNEKPPRSQERKQRANAKKRRIDDSDDEIIEVTNPSSSIPKESFNDTNRISSKDAYMLIYSRKETSGSRNHSSLPFQTSLPIPIPPPRALDVVSKLNAAHDEACEKFQKSTEEVERLYKETRLKVVDIYRSWTPSTDEKSTVVSRQALESWLSEKLIVSALEHDHAIRQSVGHKTDMPDNSPESNGRNGSCPPQQLIPIDHIVCTHGNLDPEKASSMKRISDVASQKITAETHCRFLPALSTENICKICVNDIFMERLYRIEHPQLVCRFDQLCEDAEGNPGHWISKHWLRDWRLVKPKMHIASQGDPPPDTSQFDHHVRCEHGGLSLSSMNRRRIPEKAGKLLMDLYPSWDPVPSDAELCPVCDALVHVSKEDKREVRKMVEEEKAKLKHMHDNALNGNTLLLENVPCAIVPAQFVRSWLRWSCRPTEHPRPDPIDNTPFICSHDQLIFDPNDSTDFDGSMVVVTRSDWDSIEDLYSGGPLIALEKRVSDNDTSRTFKYVHEVPVCVECRLKRKSDYEVTDITVRILNATDPLTGPSEPPDAFVSTNGRQTSILDYACRKSGGMRQSKRLRVKDKGIRRKFTVTKHTTVKDIKITLQDQLNIPTTCQRLFYRGQELEDNAATVTSLGILANDFLDLREESESSSHSDEGRGKKKRREEERGFGGTLLAQLPSARATSPVDCGERPCPVCTFCNPPEATLCGICNNSFC